MQPAQSLRYGYKMIKIPQFSQFIIEQEYQHYSAENALVWEKFVSRQCTLLEQYKHYIHSSYRLGFNKLKLSPQKIPTLAEINMALKHAGWSAVFVEDYIPPVVYAHFISEKIFPVSYNIRSLKHIAHSPMPDLIHDVIGHLPMLFTQSYHDFLQQLAQAILQYESHDLDEALFQSNLDIANLKKESTLNIVAIQDKLERIQSIKESLKINPSYITFLNRMFLWSIEFGLIGTPDKYQCYGAGILSAPQELNHIFHGDVNILSYSLDVIKHDINFTDVQNNFFVISEFKDLIEVLNQFKLFEINQKHPYEKDFCV